MSGYRHCPDVEYFEAATSLRDCGTYDRLRETHGDDICQTSAGGHGAVQCKASAENGQGLDAATEAVLVGGQEVQGHAEWRGTLKGWGSKDWQGK
jgi:hypothetical protein